MNQKFSILFASLIMTNTVLAATPIDLRHQPFTSLPHYMATQKTQLVTAQSHVDFNGVAHTRLQQTYAGYPVWNATAVVHTPKTTKTNNIKTMQGVIYKGLEIDLANTPNSALSETQKTKALEQAKMIYEQKTGLKNRTYQKESVKTIVFVDAANQAHYAYLVSFYHDDGKTGAHRPLFILDATSLSVYRQWDGVLTETADAAIENLKKTLKSTLLGDSSNVDVTLDNPVITLGGGTGGNEKIGSVVFDGSTPALPGLSMRVQAVTFHFPDGTINHEYGICRFENDDAIVKDAAHQYEDDQIVHENKDKVLTTLCKSTEREHNGVYWPDEKKMKEDMINGGYSPTVDALYGAQVIEKMYKEWYGIPVLTQADHKTPLKLVMRVHYGDHYENAFFDGEQMTFGDGDQEFYPLVSLDVAAHEISHGFTVQHSNIDPFNIQMGALHESFSDIAAKAAEYYIKGTNSWDLGRSIMKTDEAFRYMDNPTKDGGSIDNMNNFDEKTMDDPHLVAGVFNKAFYLIATTPGWDTHKAFNVMVKANMDYWNASMQTLAEAACGVVSATKDYQYNATDVSVAFSKVGIETDKC
ncbi:MAG: hypothetical protein A3E83_01700 [Gammaproteobacteria bacterium RIFCSPHIGHO2_12_FULL_41_20]|nr:MAG: hypothetical protein A3E83_01700 [Gammaproteobacteria bacterium RIFCSPHIGHO2_12_FULL_41_20]